MSVILIEDTARNNLASWTEKGLAAGTCKGAVVSPFCTKPDAAEGIAKRVQQAGGEVWFDPMTQALGMSGVGDFRHYDAWDLWEGPRGALTTRLQRHDHVSKVFDTQDQLGANTLAPTVLAESALGHETAVAVSLLEESLDLRPDCWASLSGTPAFWSGGGALDSFVGTLAQFEPEGWFLSVARTDNNMPVGATPIEVEGMCRTARSLSEYAEVHVSHGDLAALPALAAGAQSLGTGWDSRQRILNFSSFQERDPNSTFGGWLKRPTFEGLLASLTRTPTELLFNRDLPFAQSIFPGPLHPDSATEAFLHHLEVLDRVCAHISVGGPRDRFDALVALYGDAILNWQDLAEAIQRDGEAHRWIDPLLDGLRGYGTIEGWL